MHLKQNGWSSLINMKDCNVAVVIGNDHYNTLGLIRSIGLEKIPIILLLNADKHNFVSKSRYIKNNRYFTVLFIFTYIY